jgi:hypothetical protein
MILKNYDNDGLNCLNSYESIIFVTKGNVWSRSKKKKNTGIEFMMNKFDNMLLLDTIPDSQVCSCQLHGKGKGKV